jgi:protein dithiol oxidoreductase (disulfide-forming)
MRADRALRLAPRTPLAWLILALGLCSAAHAADSWQQGSNYLLIDPPQPSAAPPGKVEVTEVFSYACPACYHFYPVVERLQASLPANAVLDFIPAGFRPDEDWPMFQRAYFAAQILGVDKSTHSAMFDAVFKTGELAVLDPRTQRLKVPAPTIQDAAAFYARAAGVKPETFIAAANSFGVDTRMRQADQMIRDYRVEGTPTIIVNGKYRLDVQSAGGPDQVIELVKWLVAKETPAAPKAPAHPSAH